jgi:16S rRNA (cytosine967-C5)-methyltransferase
MRQRAELAAGDAGAVLARPEFVERRFDVILLDAPCSATGVIRRHPDILQLRRESDLLQLAREQRRLLHALYPRLKPGGRLLYATCSILPEENDALIASLLEVFPSAQVQPIATQTGTATRFGRQWLPLVSANGAPATDGFYYCLVRSPQ